MIRRLSIALPGLVPLVLMCSACAVTFVHSQRSSPPAPVQADLAPATVAASPAASGPAAESAPVESTPLVVRTANTVDMAKEYLIGPEDVLDITVWKNCPDLCRTVPVRPDGKMSLPLVNDVQAAGLTPMDL